MSLQQSIEELTERLALCHSKMVQHEELYGKVAAAHLSSDLTNAAVEMRTQMSQMIDHIDQAQQLRDQMGSTTQNMLHLS